MLYPARESIKITLQSHLFSSCLKLIDNGNMIGFLISWLQKYCVVNVNKNNWPWHRHPPDVARLITFLYNLFKISLAVAPPRGGDKVAPRSGCDMSPNGFGASPEFLFSSHVYRPYRVPRTLALWAVLRETMPNNQQFVCRFIFCVIINHLNPIQHLFFALKIPKMLPVVANFQSKWKGQ